MPPLIRSPIAGPNPRVNRRRHGRPLIEQPYADRRAGLDGLGLPGALIEATQAPAIKAELAANTAAAQALGVFGVPTFIVNGTHLFWGQYRLEHVGKALTGWAAP